MSEKVESIIFGGISRKRVDLYVDEAILEWIILNDWDISEFFDENTYKRLYEEDYDVEFCEVCKKQSIKFKERVNCPHCNNPFKVSTRL